MSRTIHDTRHPTLRVNRHGPHDSVFDVLMRALNGKLTVVRSTRRSRLSSWAFGGPDGNDGVASLRERRAPKF